MARGGSRNGHFAGRDMRSAAWQSAPEICAAYERGDSSRAIGGVFDCSPDLIRTILRANGHNIDQRRTPAAVNIPVPEDQFVSRDPCPFCNTRRDIGCRHHPVEVAA